MPAIIVDYEYCEHEQCNLYGIVMRFVVLFSLFLRAGCGAADFTLMMRLAVCCNHSSNLCYYKMHIYNFALLKC